MSNYLLALSKRESTLKISSREMSISSRDVFARSRWSNERAEKSKSSDNLSESANEAFTVVDSGRQFELTGSGEKSILVALAQNPQLHSDVQDLLTKNESVLVRSSLAHNPNLTESVQKTLSKDRIDVRINLAGNPNLKESIQIRMCTKPKESDEVVDALVNNPNLSTKAAAALLPKLTNYKKRELYSKNKSFEFQKYMYDNMKQADVDGLQSMLKNAPWTEEMQQIINRDISAENFKTYAYLCYNPNAGEANRIKILEIMQTLEDINETTQGRVFDAIGSTARTPALINDMIEKGRVAAVAQNPNLDRATILRLIQIGSLGDVNAIAKKASPTEGLMDTDLANAIINKAFENPTNPIALQTIKEISSNLSVDSQHVLLPFLNQMIENGQMTTYYSKQFLDHLANNTNLIEEISIILAKFGDVRSRASAAKEVESPQIQKAILDGVLQDIGSYDSDRILRNLVQNPKLSSDIRKEMINSKYMESLAAAILLPDLNNKELETIYNSSKEINSGQSGIIAAGIAKNVNISPDIQKLILSQGELRAIINLAQNPSLLPELQKTIAINFLGTEAGESLAERADITPESADILKKSGSLSVKKSLNENEYVPEEVKQYLAPLLKAIDEFKLDSSYRALQPSLTEQQSLLEINDPLMNVLLAANSKQPSILSGLAGGPWVRPINELLSENEAVPKDVQEYLYSLNDEEIDKRIMKNKSIDGQFKLRLLERYNDVSVLRQELVHSLIQQGYAPKEVQMEAYEKTKKEPLAHGRRNRLNSKFEALITLKNLDPEIQVELVKHKSIYVRKFLSRNENLSEESQITLARDRAKNVRETLACNQHIGATAQEILINDKEPAVRRYVISNDNLAESIQLMVANSQDMVDKVSLAQNESISPQIQKILSSSDVATVRQQLAGNSHIDRQTQLTLLNDSDSSVVSRLTNNRNLHPELRVRLRSKPPKGFSKEEYVARVHKNKYIFRILEKYMEDNSLTELAYPKNFKGTPIERYYNQPLVNAMFKENNGKPITVEHVKAAIAKMSAKEFYIFHGDFGSGIQSHEKFRDIQRHSFALLFKDLDADQETLSFMKDVAPKLAHGDHGSMGGWGEMNMGWILWKDISEMMKSPAVLIEQIQSDWRGLMSKIKAMKDDMNHPQNYQAKYLLEEWIEKYGEQSLGRIQRNLDELVKDYPEKLMAEFLSNSGVRGKTVYITGKEEQKKLIGHREADVEGKTRLVDIIYDIMPTSFGFKPSEELPGFLKLERASLRVIVRKAASYRKLIKRLANSNTAPISKELFEVIEEGLGHDVANAYLLITSMGDKREERIVRATGGKGILARHMDFIKKLIDSGKQLGGLKELYSLMTRALELNKQETPQTYEQLMRTPIHPDVVNIKASFSNPNTDAVEVHYKDWGMLYLIDGWYRIYKKGKEIASGKYDAMITDSYNTQMSKEDRAENLLRDLISWIEKAIKGKVTN